MHFKLESAKHLNKLLLTNININFLSFLTHTPTDTLKYFIFGQKIKNREINEVIKAMKTYNLQEGFQLNKATTEDRRGVRVIVAFMDEKDF